MRQYLMRHSDPKLTANVYLHLELQDARRAVEMLAADGSSPPSEAAV